MNYIDITQSSQTLNVNLNTNELNVDLSIYAEGSDSLVVGLNSNITSYNYYQTIEVRFYRVSSIRR